MTNSSTFVGEKVNRQCLGLKKEKKEKKKITGVIIHPCSSLAQFGRGHSTAEAIDDQGMNGLSIAGFGRDTN